jgi:glycosyltransferase involved in cell wall biosynthesis
MPKIKKIIYFVQGYLPDREAVSKEVALLHKNFKSSSIHNLATRWEFSFTKQYISYFYKFYPLGFVTIPLSDRKNKISHIYTSIADFPYLTLLKHRPIILSAPLTSPISKIKKRIDSGVYHKVNQIVVESDKDLSILSSLGFDMSKVSLVYPGIDLKEFTYTPHFSKTSPFRILFASMPIDKRHIKKRTELIINTARLFKDDIIFELLLRDRFAKEIKSLVSGMSNIHFENKIYDCINDKYAQISATVYAPTHYEDSKPCPNSIIESLAAGKPVLVSSVVGIADLIKKEGCGIVFKPTKKDFAKAIILLKKNYSRYQKKSRRTAEKYFSIEKFIKEYNTIYCGLE